jgi:hypothetical protein
MERKLTDAVVLEQRDIAADLALVLHIAQYRVAGYVDDKIWECLRSGVKKRESRFGLVRILLLIFWYKYLTCQLWTDYMRRETS